jgi:hypothetical protein
MSGGFQHLTSKTGYEAVLIHTENYLLVLASVFLDHFTLVLGQAIFTVIVSNVSAYSFFHLLP